MTDHFNGGAISYYSFDGHGSIRGLNDENGDLTEEYGFDAYGILIAFRKDLGDGLEAQDPKEIGVLSRNEFLFAGEQWDADMGMYYNRARYYDVENGRFNAFDAWEGRNELPASLNKYLYTNGNPVSFIDPSGNAASIGEFTVSFSLSAELAAMATTAIIYLGSKIATTRWEVNLHLEGLHMSVVAQHLRRDFDVSRYDWEKGVDIVNDGPGTPRRAVRSGFISKRPGRPDGGFFIFMPIPLSDLAKKLWEKSMGFDPGSHYDRKRYDQIGTTIPIYNSDEDIPLALGQVPYNCWTWAIGVYSKATIFALIPF